MFIQKALKFRRRWISSDHHFPHRRLTRGTVVAHLLDLILNTFRIDVHFHVDGLLNASPFGGLQIIGHEVAVVHDLVTFDPIQREGLQIPKMLVCVDDRYHNPPLHTKINYLTILEERIGGNVLNSFCGSGLFEILKS